MAINEGYFKHRESNEKSRIVLIACILIGAGTTQTNMLLGISILSLYAIILVCSVLGAKEVRPDDENF